MRKKIKNYYENLIDDIKDEQKKEMLLDKLEEIDEELLELDCDINEEIESQKCTTDEIGNDYEYYLRSVRV